MDVLAAEVSAFLTHMLFQVALGGAAIATGLAIGAVVYLLALLGPGLRL